MRIGPAARSPVGGTKNELLIEGNISDSCQLIPREVYHEPPKLKSTLVNIYLEVAKE